MKLKISRKRPIVMIIWNRKPQSRLPSIILKQLRLKKRMKLQLAHRNSYHNHQVRRPIRQRKMPNSSGVYSTITIMIRDVIMKGPKISLMVKMYIELEGNKTLLRFSLLKVKLLGKKETK